MVGTLPACWSVRATYRTHYAAQGRPCRAFLELGQDFPRRVRGQRARVRGQRARVRGHPGVKFLKAGERAAIAGPCHSKMIHTAGQVGVARLMMAAGPTLVARRDPCLCRGTPRFPVRSVLLRFVRLGTAGFEAPRLRRFGLRTTKRPSGCTRPWGQPTETVPRGPRA